MSIVYKILTIIGSLGLFLFGMKLMSEGLQKIAGTGLRNILARITANKYKGFFTGLLLTALIQSSSATTVMVVSFVNAGLLSLQESIGVILGANLGTTLTAWFISLLGFNVKISSLALPLIGIGFPLIFSSHYRRQYIGEFIIGFALIFAGLDFIKINVPDITLHPEFFKIISGYVSGDIFSILLFIGVGIIITSIIQSSSATIALTLVMCYKGWITFPLAAAMILGENIGTTITANIAAFVANKTAKRAALTHTVINLFGVIWAILFFNPFIRFINATVTHFWGNSPEHTATLIPIGLSLFHTVFNLLNVIILINFTGIIEKLTRRKQPSEKDDFSLKHISTGLLSTKELSILQAKKQIRVFGKQLSKMFVAVKNLFIEINDTIFQSYYESIRQFENQSDRMTIDISSYLTRISEEKLSKHASSRISLMLKIIDNLETIGDSCKSISKTLKRRRKNKIWFPQEFRNNINNLFSLIEKALNIMNENLSLEYDQIQHIQAKEIEKKIIKARKTLQKQHIQDIENNIYPYQAGIFYLDIINQCALLGKQIYYTTEIIAEYNGTLEPVSE